MNYQNIIPNIEYIKKSIRIKNINELQNICAEFDIKLKYFDDIFPLRLYNNPILESKRSRRNAITCREDYYISIIESTTYLLRVKVQALLKDYKRTECIRQNLKINNVDYIISNYLNDFFIKNNCNLNILENIKIEI